MSGESGTQIATRFGFTGAPATSPEKLGALMTWVGGGFTLLVGITTFFGIQEGVLARVVRTQPAPTLWVFILLGFSVVLALVVPAITSTTSAPWWLVVLVAGVIVVVSIAMAPDLPGPQPGPPLPSPLMVGGAFLVAVLILLFGSSRLAVSWSVALVILAVTSLGCGLYIVAKLSVLDKLRLESAAVVSAISTTDGRSRVEITAAGTELAGPVRVQVVGGFPGGDEDEVLGWQVLMPSRSGTLEAQASIPIPSTVSSIRVLTCQEFNTSQQKACDPTVQQAQFELELPQTGLGASMTTSEDGKQILFDLSGSGFQPGSYVSISAGPRGQEPHVTAQVRAGSDGALEWQGRAPVVGPAVWQLSAAECSSDTRMERQCSATKELATLAVAAP